MNARAVALAVGLLAAAWPALAQEEGTASAEIERWRLTIDRLRNGHYPLPLCSADDGTPIRLQEGEVRIGARRWVGVRGLVAVGDLDGDRTAEAVVVASYSGGGSGIWNYLLAMHYRDGGPVQAGVWALGIRTIVERGAIRDGRIFVTMIVHRGSDPSCCPSTEILGEFTLRDQSAPADVSGLPCGDLASMAIHPQVLEEGRKSAETERWRLTIERLRNGHYPLPLFIDDAETPIRLQAGRASITVSDTFAEWTETVILHDLTAIGDLDGDQSAEAAVVVRHNPGGSGTFVYLLAMHYRDGAPVQAGSVLLGDRVLVERLSISNGRIIVTVIAHGPSDPMCCPSTRFLRSFALRDRMGELVLEESVESIRARRNRTGWSSPGSDRGVGGD